MDFLQILKNFWGREAEHYARFNLPSGAAAAKANENYFQLTMTEMFLTTERSWFTNWEPATYVRVRFRFGDKDQQILQVAGASGLKDVDAAHLNRGVSLNYSITPLVPFNGGEIEIEAGLIAVQGTSSVKQLLKVLGDFSKVLAVPQLSTALKFAGPLADGAAELIGIAGNRPMLRMRDTFKAGNPLQAMHIVVVSDARQTLRKDLVSVVEGRLHYDGRPLSGYDYMVFRIDTPVERDDFESLSSIEEPYLSAIEALQAALLEPDPDTSKVMMREADRRLGAAKLAAYRSNELTKVIGRNQVVRALQDGYDKAKATLNPANLIEEKPGSLADVMAARISVDDARQLGEMSESAFLAEQP